LLDQLKKVPAWAWVVAAGAIVVAFLFSKRSAPQPVPVVPVYDAQPTVPDSNGAPAGQPRQPSQEDWQTSALAGLVADTRQQLGFMSLWLQMLATSSSKTSHPSRSTSGGGPVSSVDPGTVPIATSPSPSPSPNPTPNPTPPSSGGGGGGGGGKTKPGPITIF
jgi:hypothetical protein